MLIPSDITTNLPFKEVKTPRGVTAAFESIERSPQDKPMYTVEILSDEVKCESQLRIQKHEYKINSWIYRLKFDGWITGPKDLHQLLKWLKII